MLSAVDNRTFKRLTYEVIDGAATKEAVATFLGTLRGHLLRRGKHVLGITTDGSPLYSETVPRVFGPIRHQICEFHVLKEITLAILRAVAKVRKQLAAALPVLPSGGRATALRRLARRKARSARKITELFDHRHLFVRRELTAAQRSTLRSITRGTAWLRPLRKIMDEVYGLFDRRCRMETALDRLAKLRRRAKRFTRLGRALNKLFSPTLAKALTFLDEKLLPSTSNAVERGNRRHRKMQKSIYRVRTRQNLVGRMGLDLQRDQRQSQQAATVRTLHGVRAEARGGRTDDPNTANHASDSRRTRLRENAA